MRVVAGRGVWRAAPRHHHQHQHLQPGCREDKLALLWGEAQKKIAYSYLKVT